MQKERTPFRTLLTFYQEPSSLPYEERRKLQQDPSVAKRLAQLSRSFLQEPKKAAVDEESLVEVSELLWSSILPPDREEALEQRALSDPLLLRRLVQTNAVMNQAKQFEEQVSDEEVEAFLQEVKASNQKTSQAWKNIHLDFMNHVRDTFASSLESIKDSFQQFQFALQSSIELAQRGVFPKQGLSGIVARGAKARDTFLGSVVSKNWEIRSQGTHIGNIVYQDHNCMFTVYLPEEGYVYILQLDDENQSVEPVLIYPTNDQELCLYPSGQRELFEYHFDEAGEAQFLFIYSETDLLEEKLKQLKNEGPSIENSEEWPEPWKRELQREILSLDRLKQDDIKTCEVHIEILHAKEPDEHNLFE